MRRRPSIPRATPLIATARFAIRLVLSAPISVLSRVLPKRRTLLGITRFGTWDGNVKYFLERAAEDRGLGPVAVLTPRDGEVHLPAAVARWRYPSAVTAWRLLRTSTVVVDGNEWAGGLRRPLLAGARRVQLWHGSGLKAVGLLRPEVTQLHGWRHRFSKERTRYDLLVLTSPAQVEARAAAFNADDILVNGYPRNDVLVDGGPEPADDGDAIRPRLAATRAEGRSLVLYAPTWRAGASPLDSLDLGLVDDLCQRRGAQLAIKLHPKDDARPDLDEHPHVTLVPAAADIYPYLAITDVLVTDYSSVFVDFLLTDRPIVFYPYDEAAYVGGERALLLDYGDVTPGPKAHEPAELVRLIERAVGGDDGFQEERAAIRRRFFAQVDGSSSDRLIAELLRRGW